MSESESDPDTIMDSPEDSALMSPMLMGEKILNKKAVYEPSGSQRCRQMVCNRWWTIAILAMVGAFILLIAIVAAFARPGSYLCQTINNSQGEDTTEASTTPATKEPPTKDYISTDGRPFPWKNIRLPRSVLPDKYEIFLHPNLSSSVFSGNVHIHASVVTATDFIVFHMKGLNVTKVSVLRGQVEVGVEEKMEYVANEQMYVRVGQKLAVESKIIMVVEFHGTLADKLAGFYKSSYTTQSGQTRHIATTHFEPTDARAAFPCFDEPDMKANFSLSIVREVQHITLFNMPLKATTPYKGGLLQDDYETSVKMSTYLVAFVVCDFKNITGYTKQQNIMVRVFAQEDQISQAEYSLEVALKVLDYYNEFFGVPYPLPKQDLIAIPDFGAGAMENWGLITFRAASLLYDPQTTSPSDKKWIIATVAHELAHQWFGNLVTMSWWDDLWLNEGFASYVEYIGGDYAEPSFKFPEQFLLDKLQRALHLDSFTNSHPIRTKVTDPAQINEIFDDISYDKGASIIAMLQGFLGEETFKKGLHNYLTTYSFSNADTDALWLSLQNASNMPKTMTVKNVMDTWTLQMGYPVVMVRRKPGTDHLLLSQHRFLFINGSAQNNSPFNYVWKVPITYKTNKTGGEKKLVWLQEKEMTLPVTLGSKEWIKLNVETNGVYRVNYEESLWKLIIQQLKTDLNVFSSQDRAGLLDDAFALARAGELSYSIVFELLGYLNKETEYVPLKTAVNGYGFILGRMYLTDAYPKLQKFILDLISPQLKSLGWGKQSEPLKEFLQTSLLSFSVSLDDKETRETAVQKFDDLANVPKNLRSLVMNTAVQYGGSDQWLSVFHNYTTSNIPTEKHLLMIALTYTTDPRRIQLFLRDSMNTTIVRSQDTGTVLRCFGESNSGQIFAWRFLEQNWDKLLERYGVASFTLGNILKGIIAPFNTQFDYDEVNSFFKGKQLGAGQMGLKQSLEMVQSHIDWIARNQQPIAKWLESQQQAA